MLTNPPKSFQDFSQLPHSCQLHSTAEVTATASTPEGTKETTSATFLGQALQQLRQSSKQDNILLVDKTSSRKTLFVQNSSPAKQGKTPSKEVTYDDGMSNLGKSWIKPSDPKCYYVTIDAPKLQPSEYANESDKQASNLKSPDVTTAPSVYLNESETVSPDAKEPVTSVNTMSDSNLQFPATHLPLQGEYENEVPPDQTKQGIQTTDLVKSPQPFNSAHSVSQTSKEYENEAGLAYEEIPATRNEPSNATTPSCKHGTPLPPIPTWNTLVATETNPETKNNKTPKNLLGRKQDGGKTRSVAIPESDSFDEGDYVGDYMEPNVDSGWRSSSTTTEIPRKDNRKWKTLSDIPKNVKEFSISDVSLCLELLKLQDYVDKFKERNVDGMFLLKLSKKMLMEGFHMKEFEAKQLFEFAVKKWRPKK